MPIQDWWNQDSLVWHFAMFDSGPAVGEDHGVEAPEAWVRALKAVARDMRCLRYGRDVQLDGVVWELAVNSGYAVTIGWQGADGVGGFGLCHGLSMDATFGEASVWAADTVQWELAGYEFVQWPSRGHHVLVPRLREAVPVWVDPHNDGTVAAIGELCEHSGEWGLPATDR
ncbi:hypothetical protein ACVH9Z_36950 [Rhodococcus opacus]|uniref:hypothetical protein n=1 Tax=Rhodococcus TaxID=1827 RepID=UPI000EA847EC|nr:MULTISPECIES: hypothetical protein [Rhodococcus]MDI9938607.1 hypothetical protein [Rhodococcus sp. IEGM 1351]MDJ0420796.1 hypothetical protein [Rhodococcus opacus]QZS56050.1 hypothetical protein FXW36_39345 [Rhodococcus opacus]RKM70877.1 hypothetical protein COO55_01575 [Rhodococcus opacus]UZG58919.1 hypothetical protein ONE62_17180 [Rhodococcus opacus]